MIGRDTSVVCASHQQNGGKLSSIHNVMIRRVGVKRLELLRIFYRAEFGYIEGAIRRELDTEHVVDADGGNDRPHQIRMLGNHRAHQKTAIASALDRKFFR